MLSRSPSQSSTPSSPSLHRHTAPHNDQSIDNGFIIGPKDKEVLKTYLKEFQDGNRETRADVVGKALGEIYRRRPGNPTFDKKEATEV
jgi:hypothetical protein